MIEPKHLCTHKFKTQRMPRMLRIEKFKRLKNDKEGGSEGGRDRLREREVVMEIEKGQAKKGTHKSNGMREMETPLL